jgi:ABC-2 type transport system permease protein
MKRDINLILMTFYWPFLDVVIWGFLGSWIGQVSADQFNNYEAAALLGVLLWQVVGRGCNVMGLAFTEELMANNLVNLFSFPLAIFEWMLGVIIYSAGIIAITSVFSMFIIYFLYDLSLSYMMLTFLKFMPPLFFCGIWVGFTCLQALVLLGKRGMELGFIIGWFLVPFSGAYYPVEVLPAWAQKISFFLPMSYIFTGMRAQVMRQEDPTSYLIKGYVLSILYALCALLLFAYCFNRSKQKGLARLSD